MKRQVHGLIRPDGSFLIDSEFSSESDAWMIGMGWPGVDEIETAKADGYRVALIEVEIPDKPSAESQP